MKRSRLIVASLTGAAAVIAGLAYGLNGRFIAYAWGGFIIPALKPLFDYAWFVGLFAAGLTHLALARRDAGTTMNAETAELAEE